MKPPVIIRGALPNLASRISNSRANHLSEPMEKQTINPAYLTVSTTPSSHISSPTSHRKLLILDLNGSLLFRPKRYTTSKPNSANAPKIRVIHLRPYMPSFREYLLHPETKNWLDTAVWSSAQPHSVQSMVERAFEDRWPELKAIWSRDTLDLDPLAYNKKSATIKDLSKIWKSFPSHSAKTTLLVDDSTDKARLQPWNHIHVKEYGQAERRSDLDHITAKIPKTRSKPSKKRLEPASDVSTLLANMALSSSIAKTSLDAPPSSSAFDSILLAIIGILDTVKHQDNVSGWLRSGGIVLCGAEGVTEHGGKELWFNTAQTVDWWANKGRAALAKLNIKEVAGVVADR